MPIPDFVKVYEAKSDEELMQFAAAREQLTYEARLALQSELSRRQISIAEHSASSQNDGKWHDSDRVIVSERLQQGERQGVGDFVAEVLRTYHTHFWLFLKITAPAVIISTIAIITSRNEGREIARHLPRGFELLAHRTEIFEMWLANFSAWLVSWMAFSFAFGAVCIALEETEAGLTPTAWHSLRNVRERLGSFLRISLLLFVLLLVAEAASMLLGTGVFWILHQLQVRPSRLAILVVSYALVGPALLVFSRFALAIPAVILDDCRVGQAMFRSDKLTEGKWLTLAALLAKSIIGGYVAAMCPFWLASFIRITAPLPSWFPWILTIASIIGVTVVEPTMFVGFALLYLKMSALNSAPIEVLTSQLLHNRHYAQ
ncbi:MAG: hypothetical protein DMG76_35585 [Acidobacteria bacterium]|nr:MAG: hypothetical protein DMG76_35585 [Acidobacteriota bacterium]